MTTTHEPGPETDLYGFSGALADILLGKCLRRVGWSADQLWLGILRSDPLSSDLDSIYMYTSDDHPDGNPMPWVPDQTDLLALDWYTVR